MTTPNDPSDEQLEQWLRASRTLEDAPAWLVERVIAQGPSMLPATTPQPTPGEVHWYCDRRTVVRVVLARCPGTNTFRVRQLAVSIAAEGR